jgi:hypothetical protein
MYRFRKPRMVIGAYAVILSLNLSFLTSCTEDAVTLTAPEEQATPQIPDEIAEQQALGERYEAWIQKMDSYVSQAPDGTYALDWEAFRTNLAQTDPQTALSLQNGATATEDTRVILGLREGIPKANQAIKERADGVMELASVWTNYYWWGWRKCWTGDDAWKVVDLVDLGASIPGVGFMFGIGSYTLKQFIRNCGGFCYFRFWVSSYFWIKCP